VAINIDGHLDGVMPHLFFHATAATRLAEGAMMQKCASSQKTDPPQAAFGQQWIEHPIAEIVLVHGAALLINEDPIACRLTLPQILFAPQTA
jgi:hypothetical protein